MNSLLFSKGEVEMSVSTESTPFGQVCYGNEKQALNEFSKFFKSYNLSDVSLVVGGHKFPAHKLILIKSSDVFERMLSSDWSSSSTKVLELVEESCCEDVFESFLKFLYTCYVRLTPDTALPVLILADKYNVVALQRVCIEFAKDFILPHLDLKVVFHEWFQYSSKSGHHGLLTACIQTLSQHMDKIMANEDWTDEWVSLDRDQLIQILKSSDLRVKEEMDMWLGLMSWLHARQERIDQADDLLTDLLPLIRFPLMAPDQLDNLEFSSLGCKFTHLLEPYLHMAYKYRSMSLPARSKCSLFRSSMYAMRDYTEIRWERRFVITNPSQVPRGTEVSFKFVTRSCSVPAGTWEWEFKVYPRGSPTSSYEEVRCKLLGVNVLLDSQSRPVEYLLSAVTSAGLVASVAGRKTVNRNKPVVDLDLGRCLSGDSPCSGGSTSSLSGNVSHGNGQGMGGDGLSLGSCITEPNLDDEDVLCLQLTLRPAD